NDVHLTFMFVHRIDAHQITVAAPAWVQVAAVFFSEGGIRVEASQVVAHVVIAVVHDKNAFISGGVGVGVGQQPPFVDGGKGHVAIFGQNILADDDRPCCIVVPVQVIVNTAVMRPPHNNMFVV